MDDRQRELGREANRRYRLKNKEKLREFDKRPDRIQKAKERLKKIMSDPIMAEKIRTRARDRLREKRALIRKELIYLMGGKCAVCGFEDYRALQIDHVNSDGSSHREKMYGNIVAYHKEIRESVISGEGRFQILCANCNWIKRHDLEEHAKRKDLTPHGFSKANTG